MGVRSFDLWHHQPHPPGYPLFIFFGWLGTKLFHATTESSLYFASAFGGGLFIAAWFSIIRIQFSERLAWWVATSLLITPVVWMTATKAVTDMLAAGFMSAELLAAICFLKQGKRGLIVWAAHGRRRSRDAATIVSGCRSDSRYSAQASFGERQDMVVCVCAVGRWLPPLALTDVVHSVAIAARRAILACLSRARVQANGAGA